MIIKPFEGIRIYGDLKYRNKECPIESAEQQTFINTLKREYKSTHGRTVVHIENEGQVKDGQFLSMMKRRAMGSLNIGASDIFIPGRPSFLMELKRQDRTQSDITQDQLDYLYAALKSGSFVCIALGRHAAYEAFNDWLKLLAK